MPSVEYTNNDVIYEVTDTFEDPDTGDIVEITDTKQPFRVEVEKWLKRGEEYIVHGRMFVTEWGETLYSRSDPYDWITSNFQTDGSVNQGVVKQWQSDIGLVQNAGLTPLLARGGLTPNQTTIKQTDTWEFKFEMRIRGAVSFDIAFLTVQFQPDR